METSCLKLFHNDLVLYITIKKETNPKDYKTKENISKIAQNTLQLSDIVDVKVRKNSRVNRFRNLLSRRKPIDFEKFFYAKSSNNLPKIIEFKQNQLQELKGNLKSQTENLKSDKNVRSKIHKLEKEIGLLQIKEIPNEILKKVSRKSSEDIRNLAEIANYSPRNQFMELYRTKIVPLKGLKIKEKDFIESIDQVLALSDQIEFNSINDDILKHLKTINERVLAEKIDSDPKKFKKIINDLILFHCLVPVKIVSKGNGIQRNSADVISSSQLKNILMSLSKQKTINLNKNYYFSHLSLKGYKKFSIAKKMIFLNLTNMVPENRRDFLKTTLLKKFINNLDKIDITKWFFACSGAIEQYYLNTCVSTGICQQLASQTLTLPQILLIAENSLKELEKKSSRITDGESKKYFHKRVLYERVVIDKLKNKLLEAMDRDVSVKDLNTIARDIFKVIQRMGLLIDVKDIGHPTKKIIKNRWLLSSILMTPVVLFQHLIRSSKSPPSLIMRMSGVDPLPSSATSLGVRNYSVEHHKELVAQLKSLKNMTTKESKDKGLFLKFWTGVKEKNGTQISSSTHSYFLKAIYYKGQNVFILSDPMEDNYKVLTYEQFLKFVKKKKVDVT